MTIQSLFGVIMFSCIMIAFIIFINKSKDEEEKQINNEVYKREEKAFIKGQIAALEGKFYIKKEGDKYILLESIWDDKSTMIYDPSKDESLNQIWTK